MRTIQLKGKSLVSDIFEKGAYNSIVIQFVYFLCGAVVSHGAVFGSYAPFGAAFCAAVPYQNSLSSALGSILGYILLYPKGSFRYVATVITIFALRWLLNDIKAVSRSRLFAPLVAMIPLVCTGVVIAAVNYRGQSDIIMCLTEALLSAVGAYFLSYCSANFMTWACKIVYTARSSASTAVDTDFIFQGKHVSCDANQLVSVFLARLRVHTGQAAVLSD